MVPVQNLNKTAPKTFTATDIRIKLNYVPYNILLGALHAWARSLGQLTARIGRRSPAPRDARQCLSRAGLQ